MKFRIFQKICGLCFLVSISTVAFANPVAEESESLPRLDRANLVQPEQFYAEVIVPPDPMWF